MGAMDAGHAQPWPHAPLVAAREWEMLVETLHREERVRMVKSWM